MRCRDLTCRFPGCTRHAAASATEGAGRPPGYCDDPEHNRAAAWRERQRLKAGPAAEQDVVDPRPVDTARRRASEVTAQLTQMAELLLERLPLVVEDIRTAGDLDAAEAQIEAIQSEADEHTTAANNRAVKAEQARRRAEIQRDEADAAAQEAVADATQLQETLDRVRAELATSESERSTAADEHAAALAAWGTEREELQSALAAVQGDLATATARADEAERTLSATTAQLEVTAAARTEAEERAQKRRRCLAEPLPPRSVGEGWRSSAVPGRGVGLP